MAIKLGEHLTNLGAWTQKQMDQRARAGATGYELYDLTVALGRNAILGTGTWNSVNDGQGITSSGDEVELDLEHPLTQIAVQIAHSMKALNGLATMMDGGDTSFSPTKHQFLNRGLDTAAYKAGRKILTSLFQDQR